MLIELKIKLLQQYNLPNTGGPVRKLSQQGILLTFPYCILWQSLLDPFVVQINGQTEKKTTYFEYFNIL